MEKEILNSVGEIRRWRPRPSVGTPPSVPPRPETSRSGRHIWRLLKNCVRVLLDLCESGRMIRLVGPNHRPLERYQFEDPTRRDLRQFGGGAY